MTNSKKSGRARVDLHSAYFICQQNEKANDYADTVRQYRAILIRHFENLLLK